MIATEEKTLEPLKQEYETLLTTLKQYPQSFKDFSGAQFDSIEETLNQLALLAKREKILSRLWYLEMKLDL